MQNALNNTLNAYCQIEGLLFCKMIKQFIKRVLQNPYIADKHLRIAQVVLRSSQSPNFLNGLLYRIKYYLPPKSIVMGIKINSKKKAIFELDLKSYIGKEIFYGTFEPAVTAFYEKILRGKKVVWDIGSNIGYYVVMAGILLKGRGEVFAFEPVPVNFNSLQKNVKLNSLTNVTLFEIALSLEDGETEMHLLDIDRTTASPTLNKAWAENSKLDKLILTSVQ